MQISVDVCSSSLVVRSARRRRLNYHRQLESLIQGGRLQENATFLVERFCPWLETRVGTRLSEPSELQLENDLLSLCVSRGHHSHGRLQNDLLGK